MKSILRSIVIALPLAVLISLVGTVAASGQPKGGPGQKSASKSTPPPVAKVKPISTDPSKCTTANGLTLTEINELLAAHNALRSERQLPAVTWDCGLAALAQDWASKSIYDHRDNNRFGENIFVSGSPSEPVTSVVKRWMLEKPNWTNETASCTPGKVCTHYAQVMWRATKSIGCGINRSAIGKWKAMVVCNYDPASKASGPAW